MNKDAVQNERGPRNSTLRRQMAMLINKDTMMNDMVSPALRQELMMQTTISMPYRPHIMPPMVLDLSLHRNQQNLMRHHIQQQQQQQHRHHLHHNQHLHHPYLPAGMLPYPLPPPTPPSPRLSVMQKSLDQISETTAQLTFAIVNFIKKSSLSLPDKKILLEESWRELFFINVAEASLIDHFDVLLAAYANLEKTEKTPTICMEIKLCDDILRRMKNLKIHEKEYKYMRSIVLFKTGKFATNDAVNTSMSSGGSPCSSNDSKQLQNVQKVRLMYEAAEQDLMRYNNGNAVRCHSLSEGLANVKNVSSYTVQELFFRNIIGEKSLITTLLSLLEPQNDDPPAKTSPL